MATIALNQFRARQFHNAPYGNESVHRFGLKTNAAGAAIDADSVAAIGLGDVVDLGPLPEGFRLEDSTIIVVTALSASVTGSLGFKYEDGVDSADVPQSASYFGTGLVLNATGRLRNATANAVVTLPKPARLILTTAGAANAKASQLDVFIYGEMTGAR